MSQGFFLVCEKKLFISSTEAHWPGKAIPFVLIYHTTKKYRRFFIRSSACVLHNTIYWEQLSTCHAFINSYSSNQIKLSKLVHLFCDYFSNSPYCCNELLLFSPLVSCTTHTHTHDGDSYKQYVGPHESGTMNDSSSSSRNLTSPED